LPSPQQPQPRGPRKADVALWGESHGASWGPRSANGSDCVSCLTLDALASATTNPEYVMGHTDRERRRLSLQAAVLNPITEDFLRRAGISAGMRVLDIGCGVGEVSLIAARLVGSSGHVTGTDIDADSLQAARTRAAALGLQHLVFEQRDCQTAAAERYDA